MKNQMTIPWDSLSGQALRGVIEDFVTREGTEYGLDPVSLDRKVAQVTAQLRAQSVVIVFDAAMDSCSIVSAADIDQTRMDNEDDRDLD